MPVEHTDRSLISLLAHRTPPCFCKWIRCHPCPPAAPCPLRSRARSISPPLLALPGTGQTAHTCLLDLGVVVQLIDFSASFNVHHGRNSPMQYVDSASQCVYGLPYSHSSGSLSSVVSSASAAPAGSSSSGSGSGKGCPPGKTCCRTSKGMLRARIPYLSLIHI